MLFTQSPDLVCVYFSASGESCSVPTSPFALHMAVDGWLITIRQLIHEFHLINLWIRLD